MRTWIRTGSVGVALALMVAAALSAPAAEPGPLERSRTASQQLGGELLAEVRAAIAAGGPVQAIEVCQLRAPAIARGVSATGALRAGRTSLRPRNPANAPDAWERRVLERFAQRQARGEALAGMEHFAVVGSGAEREFRYMKAIGIPPDAPCLACHGARLAPDVAARLQALYPDDTAIGYAPGDLRGAFTVRVALPVPAQADPALD